MLRLSPKHRTFRTQEMDIIDPAELVIADEKVLHHSLLESFSVGSQFAAGKHVKTSSRLSSCSPSIGPNGLVRSTGCIQRLSATAFQALELLSHYFGPFNVTINQSSEKRSGFRISCLTTLVHTYFTIQIELIPSMNKTPSGMALERFIFKRETPSIN